MNRTQILHLNVGKWRLAKNSLNDAIIKDFQAICVVGSYIFVNPDNNEPTIPQDRRWQIYQPITTKEDAIPRHAFRSAVWVNAKCKATQIPIECSDTTAILLHIGDTQLFLVSCYEPRGENTKTESEESLRAMIQNIREVKERAEEEEAQDPLDLLICADWNRYDTLWGGLEALVQRALIREGEQIVNFMHDASLQSLLEVGTPTWEHTSLDQRSTIDLVLGSQRIQDKLTACKIHNIDHGSDHKAIATSFCSSRTPTTQRKGKRLTRTQTGNSSAHDSRRGVTGPRDESKMPNSRCDELQSHATTQAT
jgi:exonuclease III